MKTKLLISILLLGFTLNVKGQTIKEILNALASSASHSGKTGSFQPIITKTVQVNSSSKAWMGGGHTRETVPIQLPAGTEKWYYRITVLNYDQDYSYQNNETFAYLLQNNKQMDTYNPTGYGIDCFVLGHSGDASSFMQTGNNNFRALPDNQNVNVTSFINTCTVIQDNLWIGIRNPNGAKGLKVIVEAVAWGYF